MDSPGESSFTELLTQWSSMINVVWSMEQFKIFCMGGTKTMCEAIFV